MTTLLSLGSIGLMELEIMAFVISVPIPISMPRFQCRDLQMAASDLFHLFTQSIKFYTFNYPVLRLQLFEKCDSQIDSKNEWLLLSASFTAKFGLVLVLTRENALI